VNVFRNGHGSSCGDVVMLDMLFRDGIVTGGRGEGAFEGCLRFLRDTKLGVSVRFWLTDRAVALEGKKVEH
jgi:hypothetical protein